MSTPFKYEVEVDAIGDDGVQVTLSADPDARTALAKRFDLLAIDSFDIAVQAHRLLGEEGVRVTGHIDAAVTQACIVTDAPVPAEIHAYFAVRLVPQNTLDALEDEDLFDPDSDEMELLEGSTVDLAEVAAQTLSLELNPYPRTPEADEKLAALASDDADGKDEKPANPFAVLQKLKDQG